MKRLLTAAAVSLSMAGAAQACDTNGSSSDNSLQASDNPLQAVNPDELSNNFVILDDGAEAINAGLRSRCGPRVPPSTPRQAGVFIPNMTGEQLLEKLKKNEYLTVHFTRSKQGDLCPHIESDLDEFKTREIRNGVALISNTKMNPQEIGQMLKASCVTIGSPR